jgi:hypothetical protein
MRYFAMGLTMPMFVILGLHTGNKRPFVLKLHMAGGNLYERYEQY